MKSSIRRAPHAARLAALIAAGWVLGASQQALAASTASGTSIDNTATLSFSVGGVTQTAVPSNTASFVVDTKLNLTVVKVDGTPVPVTPGQVSATPLPNPPAYLSFTVTNTGNATQDFILSNINLPLGSNSPFSGNTEFAVSNCRTFVENGGAAGLQIGSDTEAIYLDNVAAETSRTVYLVCSTPLTATNGQDAAAGLVAEAVDAAGTSGAHSASYTNAQLTAPNTVGGVELVAADGSGGETGDAIGDAKFSARSAYVIQTATLSVTKTVTTICDPINGTTNPKAIPGGMVTWVITVTNTGSASATLATISDTLNANTTMDPNRVIPIDAATCSSTAGTPASGAGRGFHILSLPAGRPRGGTSGAMTVAADGDGATLAGQIVTIDFAQALPAGTDGTDTWKAGELKAGETAEVFFNVTIN